MDPHSPSLCIQRTFFVAAEASCWNQRHEPPAVERSRIGRRLKCRPERQIPHITHRTKRILRPRRNQREGKHGSPFFIIIFYWIGFLFHTYCYSLYCRASCLCWTLLFFSWEDTCPSFTIIIIFSSTTVLAQHPHSNKPPKAFRSTSFPS